MNKNFIFKLVSWGVFLIVAVLWLLSALLPEQFGDHSLSWLISVFAFGMGLIYVLRGILEKELGTIRKFYVCLGALFGVAGVCALIGTFISAMIAFPVIAVVFSAAGLISVIFVRDKKWDAGDNQSSDYKDYRQRKAEAEKKAAEESVTTDDGGEPPQGP